MMTDPIADMLTRIRNAILVRKREVIIPFSQLKWRVAKILKEDNYIESFEKVAPTHSFKEKDGRSEAFHSIVIALRYVEEEGCAIRSLKRVSKPGRRVYVKKTQLPTVLNRLGIAIISTPQGIMTNKEAFRRGLGGEVLCEIY